MSRNERERWTEEETESRRSRPGSRRNSTSGSISRKNSLKKEPQKKTNAQKPPTSTPNSAQSTPKRLQKRELPPQNLELLVTGKQILKKTDRANSLPIAYHRRPSADSPLTTKTRARNIELVKKNSTSQSSKSRETSLEDDMSLDLSQVSDFEDTNAKYGVPRKFVTSTPKTFQKPRSGSLQSQKSRVLEPAKKGQKSFDSSKHSSNYSCSRDSLYKTSSTASPYRYGRSTELDYSSVSPEYSGQSSTDLSPRTSVLHSDVAVVSPFSQRSHLSGSSCYLSWVESTEADKTKVAEKKLGESGEWNNFWANYNNSISRVPIKNYYDQCPTPYRTDNIDLADLDLNPDDTGIKSPERNNISNVIRNEGLKLTPRETQNIIKCAHILGNVLSKAIDRKAKEGDVEEDKIKEICLEEREDIEAKRKSLKLELREQIKLSPVSTKESATTQTDISLPNTKSAPRIFENILRQLSRSSIDENTLVETKKEVEKSEDKEGKDDK